MKQIKFEKTGISWTLWTQGLLFVAATIILFKTIANLDSILNGITTFLSIISPILIGFAIAYFLDKPYQSLENSFKKNKYPILAKRAKGISISIIYISLILLISIIISYLFPFILNNIFELINSIPGLLRDTQKLATEIELGPIDEFLNIEENIHSFIDTLSTTDMLEHLTTGLTSITSIALGMTSGIIDTVVALVTSIYALMYKEVIFETIKRVANLIIKEKNLNTIKSYLFQANDLFYKFIKAQILDSCILATLSTILLAILNVRFAVSLGFLLGVANMIPKFGSIFASIAVIILTFITGGAGQGILTAILLTILQQIDGNVIGPKIMGDALKINPILVFFAITVGGAYFGVIGMFISIPVMALIKIIFINIIEAKEEQKLNHT